MTEAALDIATHLDDVVNRVWFIIENQAMRLQKLLTIHYFNISAGQTPLRVYAMIHEDKILSPRTSTGRIHGLLYHPELNFHFASLISQVRDALLQQKIYTTCRSNCPVLSTGLQLLLHVINSSNQKAFGFSFLHDSPRPESKCG